MPSEESSEFLHVAEASRLRLEADHLPAGWIKNLAFEHPAREM
ncbi:MAG TPA: hypothetical protein VE913_17410 [Longimicrobium sp.]|nr:hypothetical protein [Longimicrobium sp.]